MQATTLIDAASRDEPQVQSAALRESARIDTSIALGLFSLAFLYLCSFRRYTTIELDEGIILQGAQRILDGQVLYRDFFSFFTPGSYYLNALVLRLFGDSFIAARTGVAFVGAALTPFTYLLARRVCSRETSVLVAGLMTITAVPIRFLVLHNWDSTLLACLALYCAVRMLEGEQPTWAFAAASFTSLTFLFEQSKGAGLFIGLALGFAIIILTGGQSIVFSRVRLMTILIGLTWPILVTSLYFANQSALRPMIVDWFWPIRHYSGANRVPYGYLDLPPGEFSAMFHSGSLTLRVLKVLTFNPALWISLLPLFGVALLLRLIFSPQRRLSLASDWAYYTLVSSAVTGLWLLGVVAVRPDRLHFFYLQPIFFVVLAWLLDGRNIRSSIFSRCGTLLSISIVVLLVPMAMALLVTSAGQHRSISTRRGMVTSQTQDTVLDYIQANVKPGEKILVYPYAPLYYFLTATYSSTSFEYFQPGMHTEQQLNDMLAEFSSRPSRYVIYEPGFGEHIRDAWPNTPPTALLRDSMADYILREYHPCATLTSASDWHFLFMARKDLRCPGPAMPAF